MALAYVSKFCEKKQWNVSSFALQANLIEKLLWKITQLEIQTQKLENSSEKYD